MNASGLIFIITGALLIRQVLVGRIQSTPTDTRDFVLAALQADMGTLGEVLSRRGENVTDSVGSEVATSAESVTPASGLAAEMVRLGSAAKGYVWGATGPDNYDCSGLVWKAVSNLGMYNGPRFTTSTFRMTTSSWCQPVKSPSTGDIVIWPGHHMGVVVGPDKMYSARDTARGIGYSTISGDTSFFGFEPQYWRPTTKGLS